jgi:hypothetical protein
MQTSKQHGQHPGGQRGVTLIGLIFVLAMGGMLAIVAAKVVPTFIEYRAVKNSMASAKSQGGEAAAMRAAFDRGADINSIKVIRGADLVITKDTGQPELSFAYEKRIELFTNVSLVIDYSGTTARNGVVAQKTDGDSK